ncbi:MAG TPA: Nif3-like dinuclear metal center hexameric protein [Gemmatimonadaceae bacterium]|nr:Nif3-like dinuclear metal center hexameric protein [Gemmatimonadaceae bacterium]
MTSTLDVAAYLDQLLETSAVPDYPNALNGLQLGNSGTITKAAASVDFSLRVVNLAIDQKADFLILHHGMFWGGLRPITESAYTRMKLLIENNVAVYSSHLPLDRHPVFGNNMLLCQELGLKPSGDFASYKGISIGLSGETDVATSELLQRSKLFARKHGGDAISSGFAENRRTKQWAMCTGAGASSETLEEAYQLGCDTLIVGEGPHHTAVQAEELGIVVIYAGHYATETLGVRALAEHIAKKFALDWTTIHAPTGL